VHQEVAVHFLRYVAVGGVPPVRVDVKLVDGRTGRIIDAREMPGDDAAPVISWPVGGDYAVPLSHAAVTRSWASVTFMWLSWLDCGR
jgi:hypothetical protein